MNIDLESLEKMRHMKSKTTVGSTMTNKQGVEFPKSKRPFVSWEQVDRIREKTKNELLTKDQSKNKKK